MSSPAVQKLLARYPGKFAIERKLGEGAMGEVWLARVDGRQVALKVLITGGAGSDESVKRFLQEGQLLLQLDHPNVLKVHEIGSDPELPYLVCEYVEGVSLDRVIDSEAPIPWGRALDIFGEILGGLKAAHAQGIIHRDIKPSNVLVNREGRCKLADFGIAKAERLNAVKTNTGMVMGTPAYMAPELVLGAKPTPAADVYSMGVLLVELLTGETPYGADSVDEDVSELFTRKLRGIVPLVSKQVQGLPRPIDKLVEKAMFREPTERCPTAAALLVALDDCRKLIAQSKTVAATATQAVTKQEAPARQRGSGRTPAPAAVAGMSPLVPIAAGLLVFFGALGMFVWRSSPRHAEVHGRSADPLRPFKPPAPSPKDQGIIKDLQLLDPKVADVMASRRDELKAMDPGRAAAILWVAQKSARPELAKALNEWLAEYPDALAVPALVGQLAADPDPAHAAVRQAAGKRLAELVGPDTKLDPSDCPDPEVQSTQLCTLLKLTSTRTDYPDVVRGAIRCLAWLRCPCTDCVVDIAEAPDRVNWLLDGVDDPAREVARALEAIGTPEAKAEAEKLRGAMSSARRK